MNLNSLSEEQSILFAKILENDLSDILKSLRVGVMDPKTVLKDIDAVIEYIGTIWIQEHDIQGKQIVATELISQKQIDTFFSNCKTIFGVIRPRLPILSSHLRIAVGTLLTNHDVAELLELKLRSKGLLTYYFGHSLTTATISKQIKDYTPINVLVLSIMAVNDQFNGFEELLKLRKAQPQLKIIVGGSAFKVFELLKDNNEQTINKLANPYRAENFRQAIKASKSIPDFLQKVFDVDYAETFESLLVQAQL